MEAWLTATGRRTILVGPDSGPAPNISAIFAERHPMSRCPGSRRTAALALAWALTACSQPPMSAPTDSPPGARAGQLATEPDTGYVTLVGAGDIAGCRPTFQDSATAALIDSIPGAVFTAGDNANPRGNLTAFNCYDATWGKFKSRTRPAPGNHDYDVTGAARYFKYFGALAGPPGKGYYSYDLGGWHIVSLNSEANLVEQRAWLKADLAAHPAGCTLAYWHRPLFTSGLGNLPDTNVRPLFRILFQAGAEIVISGHNHQYERFAPQNPWGKATPLGIRQFVVGTGGGDLYGFGTIHPNSEQRYFGSHGVLLLRLFADRYEFEFVPVAGATWSDSGGAACH